MILVIIMMLTMKIMIMIMVMTAMTTATTTTTTKTATTTYDVDDYNERCLHSFRPAKCSSIYKVEPTLLSSLHMQIMILTSQQISEDIKLPGDGKNGGGYMERMMKISFLDDINFYQNLKLKRLNSQDSCKNTSQCPTGEMMMKMVTMIRTMLITMTMTMTMMITMAHA